VKNHLRIFFYDDRDGLSLDQTFLKLFLYDKIISESLIHFSSVSILNYPNGKINHADTDVCKKFFVIPDEIKCEFIGSKEKF